MNYKIATFVFVFCLSANCLCLAQGQEEKDYYATFLDGTNLVDAVMAIESQFGDFFDDDVTTQTIQDHLQDQLDRGDIGIDCKVEIPHCMTCPPFFSPHNPNNLLGLRYHQTDGIDSFQSTYLDIQSGHTGSSAIRQPGAFFENLPVNTYVLFTFQFYCGDNISDVFIIIVDKDIDLRGGLEDARNDLALAGVNFPNETNPGNAPPPLPLELFPNPANQQLGINLQLAEPEPTGVEIALFDFFTGKVIRSISNSQALSRGQHSFSMNTAELPNGNYFLKIQGDGIHQVKKILILH